MPAVLRKHVRYPELLLKMQAAVYGLYHMTDPAVFYNREDLWTVASEEFERVRRAEDAGDGTRNRADEIAGGNPLLVPVEILLFDPAANRNNLIG